MKKYLKLVFILIIVVFPLFSKAKENIKFNELYNPLDKEWVNGIKEGKTLDFAYTAESNGYPNPQIVLKWQNILQISSYQSRLIHSLQNNTSGYALVLGKELIQLETNLQLGFIDKSISNQTIRSLVYQIEKIKAELRVIHLLAYKQMAEILNSEQTDLYYVLKTQFINEQQKNTFAPIIENGTNEYRIDLLVEPKQTNISTQEVDTQTRTENASGQTN